MNNIQINNQAHDGSNIANNTQDNSANLTKVKSVNIDTYAAKSYIEVLNRQQDLLTENMGKIMSTLKNNLNAYINNQNIDHLPYDKNSEQISTYNKLSLQVVQRDPILQEKIAQNLSSSKELIRSKDAPDMLVNKLNNLPTELKEGTKAGQSLSKFLTQNLVNLTKSQNMGAGLQRALAIRQIYLPDHKLDPREINANANTLSATLAFINANQKDDLAKNTQDSYIQEDKEAEQKSSTAQVMTRYLRKALNEFPEDSTYLDIFKQNKDKLEEQPYKDKVSAEISNRIHNIIAKAAQTARRGNLIPQSKISQNEDIVAVSAIRRYNLQEPNESTNNTDTQRKVSELSLSELSARAAKLQSQFRDSRLKLAAEGKLPDPAPMPEEISVDKILKNTLSKESLDKIATISPDIEANTDTESKISSLKQNETQPDIKEPNLNDSDIKESNAKEIDIKDTDATNIDNKAIEDEIIDNQDTILNTNTQASDDKVAADTDSTDSTDADNTIDNNKSSYSIPEHHKNTLYDATMFLQNINGTTTDYEYYSTPTKYLDKTNSYENIYKQIDLDKTADTQIIDDETLASKNSIATNDLKQDESIADDSAINDANKVNDDNVASDNDDNVASDSENTQDDNFDNISNSTPISNNSNEISDFEDHVYDKPQDNIEQNYEDYEDSKSEDESIINNPQPMPNSSEQNIDDTSLKNDNAKADSDTTGSDNRDINNSIINDLKGNNSVNDELINSLDDIEQNQDNDFKKLYSQIKLNQTDNTTIANTTNPSPMPQFDENGMLLSDPMVNLKPMDNSKVSIDQGELKNSFEKIINDQNLEANLSKLYKGVLDNNTKMPNDFAQSLSNAKSKLGVKNDLNTLVDVLLEKNVDNTNNTTSADKSNILSNILSSTVPADDIEQMQEAQKQEPKLSIAGKVIQSDSDEIKLDSIKANADESISVNSANVKHKDGFFKKLGALFGAGAHNKNINPTDNIKLDESTASDINKTDKIANNTNLELDPILSSTNSTALSKLNSLDQMMHILKGQIQNQALPDELNQKAQELLKQLQNPISDLKTVNNWLNFVTGPMQASSPQALALHQWAFFILCIRFEQIGRNIDKFIKDSKDKEKIEMMLSSINKNPKSKKLISDMVDDTLGQIERLQNISSKHEPDQILPRYIPLPPNYEGGREGSMSLYSQEDEENGKTWHLNFIFDLKDLGLIEIRAVSVLPEIKISVITQNPQALLKVQELMPQLQKKLQDIGITTRTVATRLGHIKLPEIIKDKSVIRSRVADGSSVSIDI